MEGEWKEEKEAPDFIAMLNKIQQENAFLKNHVMSLAKGSAGPTQDSGSTNKAWKTVNTGPAIYRDGKQWNWCSFHNKRVCSHASDKCFLNPQHP